MKLIFVGLAMLMTLSGCGSSPVSLNQQGQNQPLSVRSDSAVLKTVERGIKAHYSKRMTRRTKDGEVFTIDTYAIVRSIFGSNDPFIFSFTGQYIAPGLSNRQISGTYDTRTGKVQENLRQ